MGARFCIPGFRTLRLLLVMGLLSAPPLAAQPDLVVTNVNVAPLTSDWQNLTYTADILIDVRNIGSIATGAPSDVTAFDDLDLDGLFDPMVDTILGSSSVPILTVGTTQSLSIGISASPLFRESPVHVFVDSGSAIAEVRENNNIARSNALCQGLPTLANYNDIIPTLTRDDFSMTLFPDHDQVMCTPVVIDLDMDGSPEILFSSFEINGFNAPGVLRAIRSTDGSEVFSVGTVGQQVLGSALIAAGDIDQDGFPEIVAMFSSGDRLICFEHDGTFKWLGDVMATGGGWQYGAPSIGNVTGDSAPEVVFGSSVLDANGGLIWEDASAGGTAFSSLADVDLDGDLEIIAGGTIWLGSGVVYNPVPSILAGAKIAVGNFNSDPYPEIVVVSNGTLALYDSVYALLCGPTPLPGFGDGGVPVIADFDGDGEPEVCVANGSSLTCFDVAPGACSVLWSVPIQDVSSARTSACAFDFDGDGAAEVVHNDEAFLHIFDGSTGTVLFQIANSNATLYESPVVCDLEGDGHAEIVVVSNDYAFGSENGIRVYESASQSWVGSRSIWSQQSYHITNVNDDGSIPTPEMSNWLHPIARPFNNYRMSSVSDNLPLGAPDLVTCFLRCSGSSMTVRIGNAGVRSAAAGIEVSFTDDLGLLGTATTSMMLSPGMFEDVTLTASAVSAAVGTITVIADDDGASNGTIAECNEMNNFYVVASLPCGSEFRRGDANDDGAFDIGDTIYVLATLFSGGPPSSCDDAADLNDDGANDIGDAIYGLASLFSGGPQPGAPGPTTCGTDPSSDGLDCAGYTSCP